MESQPATGPVIPILDNRPLILIVEDHAPNVMVAETFLENFGYRTRAVGNGIEAFELLKLQRFAAVLMDVQMPGMNGFETTQLIREYERQQGLQRIPIIGVTAHALAGDRERCLAASMDEYIPKPFDPAELQKKLSEIIASDQRSS